MPLVTYRPKSISFDTLPAIKIHHYYHCTEQEMVYTYLKLFATPKGIHFSTTCFERFPVETSRVGFLLQTTNPSLGEQAPSAFFCSCAPSGEVSLEPLSSPICKPHTLHSSTFTGNDEQGHYWSVNFTVSTEFLVENNYFTPAAGITFNGNFFKYQTGHTSYGAAFEAPGINFETLPTAHTFLTNNSLQPFEIVSY